MHKARHKLVQSPSSTPVQPARKAGSVTRIGLIGLIAAVLVLVVAWIDGGEEPIHRIETSVAVPVAGEAG
ncbi:MAG: hypothetical protein AAF553_09015 [Pseudomonadota bacterium]